MGTEPVPWNSGFVSNVGAICTVLACLLCLFCIRTMDPFIYQQSIPPQPSLYQPAFMPFPAPVSMSTPLPPPGAPLLYPEASLQTLGTTNGAPLTGQPQKTKTSKMYDRMKVWKAIAVNFVVITLLTGIVFVYTLVGGIIINALEDDAARTECERFSQQVVDQGFNAAQLAWLAGHDIPYTYEGSSTEWDLLGGQFFAMTLVTTIGYGHTSAITTAARVFIVFYSFVGILLAGYCLITIGKHMFRLVGNCLLLFLDIFLSIDFGEGTATVMRNKIGPLFEEVDEDGTGTLDLLEVRHILWKLDDNHNEDNKPDWETVCKVATEGDQDRSGDIDKEEFPQVVKEFAKILAAKKEEEQNSVLIFKVPCLTAWPRGCRHLRTWDSNI